MHNKKYSLGVNSMPKQRKLPAFLLAVLITASLFNSISFAGQAPTPIPTEEVTEIPATERPLTGTSTTQDAVIKISVPQNINLLLDPYELITEDAEETQIVGGIHQFINSSNIPVQFSLTFQTELADGVEIVTDESSFDNYDINDKDKKFYLSLLGATSYASSDFVFDKTATESTFVPFDNDGKASVDFILEKGDGTTLSTDSKSFAAFKYYGLLNTYASWADNDIKINATYKLTAHKTTAYADMKPDTIGLNQMKPLTPPTEEPPVILEPGFYDDSKGANAHTSAVFALKKSEMPTTHDIKFNADGKTVTMTTSSGGAFPAGDYSYNPTTNTLTINKSRLDLYKNFSVGATVIAHIKLAGETDPYIVNFIIT
jgi:hypothetical protein